ncbi:uncharacterized protein LOC116431902 isoform X2 [Nomia melanderi]|uniref:uncharacterized protein LOC116431902 isoform X2 n=1 Tax=Nomia melanderi TaxID=2448451 RepID=UPI00130407B9|nr:uncharacterized protein LOC116431902 isoform X2 [Nomia melanderi]
MEQADEVQINTVEVQSIPIIDLSSSLEPHSDNHVTIVENIPENRENCSQDYKDNVIETPLATDVCDLNIAVEEIAVEEKEIMKNVNADVINKLDQEVVNNDIQEAIENNIPETINNETEEDENQSINNVTEIEEKEPVETSEVKDNEKYVENESINEENIEVLNDDQERVTCKDKETQNLEEDNVCIITDTSTADTSAQCQALIKSISQTFESKDQSLHVADTDADLTKLVDGDSEVMVVTVETVDDSSETMEENIVVTVHEKDVTVNPSKNDPTTKTKETEETKIVNEEFDLIDYSQETDGTIIEVISTEVVQSEVSETSIEEEDKEILKHSTSETDPIISTVSKITCKPEIVHNVSVNEDEIERKSNDTDQENSEEQIEVQSDNEAKTEHCDSPNKNNLEEKHISNETNVIPTSTDNTKEESEVNEIDKPISITTKRSVIQDIFDDWGDENAEEDNQSVSKEQDIVEIELKSLLDDTKTTQNVEEGTVMIVKEEIACIGKEATDTDKTVGFIKGNKEMQISKEQSDNNQTVKKQQNVKSLKKESVNFTVSQNFSKSLKNTTHDSITFNQTSSQTKIISHVNRGRSFSSQIASQAEVTEALKERFREKQKMVEAPPGPDIFFVKKLTQRLSSKLGGGPMSTLPALIPLSQPAVPSTPADKKTIDNANVEINKDINIETNKGSSKESSSDNKELLAILEGDVDPDWSNLKPPTLTEEGKGPVNIEETGHNTPPKLDPLVERELALKQLLELPITSVKKVASRKKKTFKSASNKATKDMEEKPVSEVEKEVISIDLETDSTEPILKDTRIDADTSAVIIETTPEKSIDLIAKEVRVDESRSGRKRKLTEKAREHEEQLNIVKRQKVYKNKVSLNKKQSQDNEVQSVADATLITENHEPKQGTIPNVTSNEAHVPITKEEINKELTNKVDSTLDKLDSTPIRRPKQNLNKKGSQSIPKRNIVVKKILKQNMSSGKKVALKAKLSATSKKSGSKVTSKSKQSMQSSSGDSKPKKKIINEIDRLLQDEGVVNLLYDVEQPDKKRLIPITKSQAKVMDIQKVQRELNFRKKLVRNAVLRLRTATTGVSKVSPRSKRTSIHLSDVQTDKKVGEQIVTGKSNATSQQEFILPAKIRNAADASVIIRRHSSSSFSSASGSPRVSIDSPEKVEGSKTDEGSHSLRSMKRRLSDEATNAKKSKKKTVQRADTETIAANNIDDKALRPKKSDSKKGDKNSKQVDATVVEETSSGKVITRSNGTTTGEDELSACLAEAVSALSVVSAGNRSGSSTANRKSKVTANVTKISESDNNKTKTETRSQFSNKEINVRRHGNLVQLILTPSSSTKLRNALTLQMMQEFRETLSILERDDDCRVVLLTSTGSSFCEGLELSMLLHTNKEERRLRAEEMADAVKDFIKSLASFNKPIVAGVQGAAVGLGVTMLPLFDLVIASDKATFSTPYGKLGQIAEGAAVFTLSHILGSAITSELLLGGRTLTASEALRAGLVTRVLWPDRFQVELLPTLKAMSEQSSQSMEATKALLRHSLRKKLDAALESETYLLIQHWCSTECQTAVKAYIDGKVQ